MKIIYIYEWFIIIHTVGFSLSSHLNSSSSSSGNGAIAASFKSVSMSLIWSASIIISAGLNAGASTRYRFGSPTNLFNNHKKGFSNW